MAIKDFDFEKEPTVVVVKRILNDAIKMKASDIHFDPTEESLLIKFRINGELVLYTTAPENVKTNIITRVKILAGMNITEYSLPQIGNISIETDSKSHSMRVSSLPVLDGEKITCHITNYKNSVKKIEKLGFSDGDIKKILKLLKESNGIILVTGNSNSGKTTTIYSMLKEINTPENNIISIEDPISMKLDGINQVEVNLDKGISYKNILKNILLQDPNVVSIGELVDDEVARYALRTSISGRLVISSLQSKTIYQTIENLLHMDVENYLLGSNLKGIISQRLVKRLCPMCREKRKATDYERNVIKKALGKDVTDLYYPSGCDDCKDGYIGLIPVSEVIIIDNELKHAISNKKSLELIRSIIYESNDSILVDGFNKAINGDTSFQEVIRIMDLDEDISVKDNDLKRIILGEDIEEDKTVKDEEKVETKKKKKEKEKVGRVIGDYSKDDEMGNVDDDTDSKSLDDVKDDDEFSYDDATNDEYKEDNNNLDASEKLNDAKDLLNRLMGKGKKDKASNEKDNNDVSKNNTKKKSTFNYNDVTDEDDEGFDYSDYENNF